MISLTQTVSEKKFPGSSKLILHDKNNEDTCVATLWWTVACNNQVRNKGSFSLYFLDICRRNSLLIVCRICRKFVMISRHKKPDSRGFREINSVFKCMLILLQENVIIKHQVRCGSLINFIIETYFGADFIQFASAIFRKCINLLFTHLSIHRSAHDIITRINYQTIYFN